MVKIFNKDTNEFLCDLSDDQFQILADEMEEESAHDNDYYLNADFVSFLEEENTDSDLVAKIKKALGTNEEIDIKFKKQ